MKILVLLFMCKIKLLLFLIAILTLLLLLFRILANLSDYFEILYYLYIS
jgi:hypothetical protein